LCLEKFEFDGDCVAFDEMEFEDVAELGVYDVPGAGPGGNMLLRRGGYCGLRFKFPLAF
jgi:hypothetical protein